MQTLPDFNNINDWESLIEKISNRCYVILTASMSGAKLTIVSFSNSEIENVKGYISDLKCHENNIIKAVDYIPSRTRMYRGRLAKEPFLVDKARLTIYFSNLFPKAG